MRRESAAIFCLLFLFDPFGPGVGQTRHVQSVVDVERGFASTSRARGTRDAFLAFIADDGILFRPGPVNGRNWLLASRANPGVLIWEPARAEVAGTGDLGYTTGPWEFRGSEGKPVSFRQYATVWRKQSDGAWKFGIATGIKHAEQTSRQPALVVARPG